ncbi:hypothetical protein Athai_09050 [Actinocatenispora thailandica]|uniref:CBS domain-containing protein n=1 Tax=Actinocatenispora thailandica TaxID=227318 RepID=A0A7R7DKR2_9ACTN|nr:CBS domain-containing protein [Actinocatenispora thailandica]BCJ33402.1 hypothetical protein Athai_09050 [Actinocatenispora thailandica]
MTTTTVRDVMSAPVVTANEDTTYKQATELLLANRVGALPVLDGQGHVVGVVSESDLLAKVALVEDAVRPGLLTRRKRRHAQVKAASDRVTGLMSAPARAVSAGATVPQAARLMRDGKVKHLPVLDDAGLLVGIVARNDLLRDFLRSDRQIRAEVLRDVVRGALATDPSEVSVEVSDGVVTLSGQLERAAGIPIAVHLTWMISGVVDVVDKLVAARPEARPVPGPTPPYGPLRA